MDGMGKQSRRADRARRLGMRAWPSRIGAIPVLLGSLVLLQTPVAAQNDTTTADELLRLEKRWNDAHLKGNAAALDHLWSDDLEVVVPKMPVMKKADVLAFARSGKMKFDAYTTSDLHVRLYGDTAVVSGRMKRSRTLKGQSIDDNWQFTKVYRREGGLWRVVNFQASEVPSD